MPPESVGLALPANWKMPIGWNRDRDPAFGPWRRIEYSRGHVGERELSSLPYGEYYVRYLIRP